ncbi:NAD-dependent protein deacetylase sirtuin-1 [Antechinus flavipes]|uniref:NAD-dependent protein deacetylase sirtuin-1 n=1 Tax=Antechinus flavipes TaxID=38775 RepID=UPI002236B602|nr:NAD-dependent protein deacetylase sirtuin-1 [Antechinus flavipes]
MADEATFALEPGAGGGGPAEPSGEPLSKRQRRDGPGPGPGAERAGGAGSPGPEAAAASLGEASDAVAPGGDNGPGPRDLRGLPREPPPQPPPDDDDEEEEDDDEEEEEEGGEDEDEAAAAIGYRENLFSDEILANGFHSCDSDEDDRASHASSSDWTPRPRTGPYTFVQQHLMIGTDPRTILKDLLPETIPPPELDDMTLWQIVINILSEPPKRKKRKDINTIEDAVKLLQECKKIIVLTGAGVSVSCGIPDFRSRDGIYARLAVDFPDLPDPQAMFDIEYFRKDPRPFFKFAKEIYPGQFQPSLCHKFIALSDKEGKLLRNYTQNIDTLEQVAGIQRIIQCHGSFATASCLICKYKVDSEAVRDDIFNQVVPRCPRCPADEPLAIMKPEIVFFGENLPEQFHRAMKYDKDEVDLLIVIGSSLKVRPVALIPSSIPHEVPQILINREPLPHLHFDVELLGDCDVIINELCQRLGGEYSRLCPNPAKLSEITDKPPRTQKDFSAHWLALPPTPLNVSEDSSSPGRTSPPHSWAAERKPGDSDEGATSRGGCKAERPAPEGRAPSGHSASIMEQLEDPGAHSGENREKNERTSVMETLRKCWPNRLAKEQISKRLDGNQYLFLPPNRYIFHGAEVYSDSEDDVLSSSSCGSNSDSGTCHSPSLEEPIEDESEMEEFYNGLEDDADVAERGGPGCVCDRDGQRAVNEAASAKDEMAEVDHPSNRS